MLLLFMALASILFALGGVIAARLEQHRRQRSLAGELGALGATVFLVNDSPAWLLHAPRSLQSALGDDAFANVDHIDLVGVPVDERVIAALAACTDVRFLDLSYSTVTDEQLARLKPLEQLRVLNLSNTGVTDASIAALIGHETLVDLDISGTLITEEAVASLQAALPHLDIDH